MDRDVVHKLFDLFMSFLISIGFLAGVFTVVVMLGVWWGLNSVY